MLSASANWLASFRASEVAARIVAVLRISNAGSIEGTHIFTFTSGSTAYGAALGFFFAQSIAAISGLSAEIDPKARTLTVGQASLDFISDGALKDLLRASVYLKHKTIEIYIRDALLTAAGDGLPLGVWIVDDLRSTAVDRLSLLLKDFRQLGDNASTKQTSGLSFLSTTYPTPQKHSIPVIEYPSQHPLELATSFLITMGVDPTAFIGTSMDASTWGPNALGHFNCSRFSVAQDNPIYPTTDVNSWSSFDGGIQGEFNYRDALNEIGRLMGGTILVDPAENLSSPMQWQFRRYFANASPLDTWTEDDIDELELYESWTDIVNAYEFRYASSIKSSPIDWVAGLRRYAGAGQQDFITDQPAIEFRDTASVARYIGPGDSTGVHKYSLTSLWLNGIAYAEAYLGVGPITQPVGTGTPIVFRAVHAAIMGICGCRYNRRAGVPTFIGGDQWTIPSWAVCSVNQPVYIRVTGATTAGYFLQEIMRVTTIAPLNDGSNDRAYDAYYLPYIMQMTVDQRGLFGTTAVDWSIAPVIQTSVVIEDVTIPVYLAQNLLPRASDGLVKLRCTTGIAKQPVQLGDTIAISDRRAAIYGYDHIDPAVRWEVVRKTSMPMDAKQHIEWILALKYNPAATPPTIAQVANGWFSAAPT